MFICTYWLYQPTLILPVGLLHLMLPPTPNPPASGSIYLEFVCGSYVILGELLYDLLFQLLSICELIFYTNKVLLYSKASFCSMEGL